MSIRVANIRLELGEPEEGLPEKIAGRLGSRPTRSRAGGSSARASTRAATTTSISVYSAEVQLAGESIPRVGLDASARHPAVHPGATSTGPSRARAPLRHRPVIVGSGPAGLIAGYLLAESGYRPLILERGRAVKDRVADVRRFDENGPLDPESNYLFGEGGRARSATAS